MYSNKQKTTNLIATVVIVLLFDHYLIRSLIFAFHFVQFCLLVAAVALSRGVVWRGLCFYFLLFASLFGFHFLLLLLLCCAMIMAHSPLHVLWCCCRLDVWFTPPSPQRTLLLVLTMPFHSPSHTRMHTHTCTHASTHASTHAHTDTRTHGHLMDRFRILVSQCPGVA